MRLEACREEIGRRATLQQCAQLRSMVGLNWMSAALRATDASTIRGRKLPNQAMVSLVVGMALFRNRSIDAIVKHLGLAPPGQAVRPSPTSWRDLSLFTIDGSTLPIPDTSSKEETFGHPDSGRSKADPEARVVRVLAAGGRLMPDFVAGALDRSETVHARPLVEKIPRPFCRDPVLRVRRPWNVRS